MTRRAISAVIAAALLIGGCASEPVPPETSVTGLPPATHGSLAECLPSHGIDAPATAILGPPTAVDQATWDQAMGACSQLAPGPAG
ncbi:MAG: hypothetical protein WCI74_15610 [Actinomycetes bacterium]